MDQKGTGNYVPDHETLLETASDFDRAQEIAKIGSWHFSQKNGHGHFRWSKQAYRIFDIPESEDVGYARFISLVHESDRTKVESAWQAAANGGRYETEFRIVTPDGIEKWIRETAEFDFSEPGKIVSGTGTVQDITESKLASERLRLWSTIFEKAQEGFIITDPAGIIVDVNRAWCDLTGYSREEVVGRKPSVVKSGKQGPEFYRNLWAQVTTAGHWRGELWNRRKNGDEYAELLSISAIRDETGDITHFIGTSTDVTNAKRDQEILDRLAHHDPLTGLPNRTFLSSRIKETIAESNRHGDHFGLCFIDLDGFKPVNDTHGHDAGDALLCEVARRLKHAIREADIVARIGGDEFVVLIRRFKDRAECSHAVNRLLDSVKRPYSIKGQQVEIGASIGVATYPDDAVDADLLLRHADQAMYMAKTGGKGQIRFFSDRANSDKHSAAEKIRKMEEGLRNGEFEMRYQPKVDFLTGSVVGLEALCRWTHPEDGIVSPTEFLPLMEGTRFSDTFGDWTVRKAMEDLAKWNAFGHRFRVGVNLSPSHLRSDRFAAMASDTLARFPGVEASQVEFEIVETAALENLAEVSETIGKLRQLGFTFAIDDFGTGYSSLSYLKQLQTDVLKIDRAFVNDMMNGVSDLNVVEGIVGLARSFNQSVVAEGVETAGQAELLCLLGCHMGQGYAISKPMRMEEVLEWTEAYSEKPLRFKKPSGAPLDKIREHLELLSARDWHRQWSRSLRSLLVTSGETHCEDVAECRFGKWFQKHGNEFKDQAWLSELSTVHVQVRECGERMAKWARLGRPSELEADRTEFARLDKRLAELFDLAYGHAVLRADGN